MLEELVDLVAGDFNGAAWRRSYGHGRQSNACGFVKPPDSHERWKVRLHGAFTILPGTLGLRPKFESCHHEVWLHLAFVTHHGEYESRERQEQRHSS